MKISCRVATTTTVATPACQDSLNTSAHNYTHVFFLRSKKKQDNYNYNYNIETMVLSWGKKVVYQNSISYED